MRRGGLAWVVVALALAGCSSPGPIADRAPPAPRSNELQGPKPAADFFFVEGNWVWNSEAKDFFWKQGHWEKYREGWFLIPGAWVKAEEGGEKWEWKQEHWEKRPH
jgi:hypothetical protein